MLYFRVCTYTNAGYHPDKQYNILWLHVLLYLIALLSQSSTVGSLVWGSVKETLSDSKQKEEQATELVEEAVAKDPEQEDSHVMENKQKDNLKSLVSAYNCVVYGLPHITLIAPAWLQWSYYNSSHNTFIVISYCRRFTLWAELPLVAIAHAQYNSKSRAQEKIKNGLL